MTPTTMLTMHDSRVRSWNHRDEGSSSGSVAKVATKTSKIATRVLSPVPLCNSECVTWQGGDQSEDSIMD